MVMNKVRNKSSTQAHRWWNYASIIALEFVIHGISVGGWVKTCSFGVERDLLLLVMIVVVVVMKNNTL
jgi:hypothetical protein